MRPACRLPSVFLISIMVLALSNSLVQQHLAPVPDLTTPARAGNPLRD